MQSLGASLGNTPKGHRRGTQICAQDAAHTTHNSSPTDVNAFFSLRMGKLFDEELFSDLKNVAEGQRRIEHLLESLCVVQQQVSAGQRELKEILQALQPSSPHVSLLPRRTVSETLDSVPAYTPVSPSVLDVQSEDPTCAEPELFIDHVSERDLWDVALPPTLSTRWPSDLQMRDQQISSNGGSRLRDDDGVWRAMSRLSSDDETKSSLFNLFADRVPTFHPHSPLCMSLDLLSALVLLCDFLFVPFMLAWDVWEGELFMTYSWVGSGYWTVDFARVVLSVLSMEASKSRLMFAWLAIDFALVAGDWASVFMLAWGESTNFLRILRIAKAVRLVRIVKLFQMSRLARAIDDWMDRHVQGGWQACIKVSGTLFITFLCGHLVSCAWFALGSGIPSDTGARWLDKEIGQSRTYNDLEVPFLYTTALHWSVAQMTLGCNEIISSNTWERVFSISMLLFGLLLSSTLVSALSATLINFQMQSSEQNEKLRTLRRFLAQQTVDLALSYRVQQQVEQRIQRRPALTDKDVPALELLSSSLRAELRFEIFMHHLLRHPLFRLWANLSTRVAQDLCADSLDFIFPQVCDSVFHAGELCHQAYFLVRGCITYTQTPDSSVVKTDEETVVDKDSWLCEGAIWTLWITVGSAVAREKSQLLTVPAEKVLGTMKKHRVIQELTCDYCLTYCLRIRSARPPHSDWPTDLYVPFSEFGDIVVSMNPANQLTIGLDALRHVPPLHVWQRWGGSQVVVELEREVRKGQSTVVLDTNGEPERVVLVTRIRVENQGLVLAQVGKLEQCKVVCECLYPGMKQENHELVRACAKRIAHDKLGELARFVRTIGYERTVLTKESKTYQVRSTYFTTLVHMRPVAPLLIQTEGRQPLPAPVPEGSWRRMSLRERRMSWRSHDALKYLGRREVYATPSASGKTLLFAWLAPDEYEFFTNHVDGRSVLETWVMSFHMDHDGSAPSVAQMGIEL